MRIFISKTVLGIVLLTLLVVVAGAQYRAGVQGVVTDSSGAMGPDASATVTNIETNFSRTANTSAEGVFSVPGLPPGRYKITVEKTGFAEAVLEDVIVSAEQTEVVLIQLSVGQATATVTVSESAVPAIETGIATIAGSITTQQVTSLPTFGRDPFRLLQLTPGTFGTNARAPAEAATTCRVTQDRAAPAAAAAFSRRRTRFR
jgi:hypothetical protein